MSADPRHRCRSCGPGCRPTPPDRARRVPSVVGSRPSRQTELAHLDGQRVVDLAGAFGEHLEQLPGQAGDLGLTVDDRLPRHPAAVAQLGSQHRLVQAAQHPLVPLQVAGVQRKPPAVVGLDLRGDDRVGVHLRIVSPRRRLTERGHVNPSASGCWRRPPTRTRVVAPNRSRCAERRPHCDVVGFEQTSDRRSAPTTHSATSAPRTWHRTPPPPARPSRPPSSGLATRCPAASPRSGHDPPAMPGDRRPRPVQSVQARQPDHRTIHPAPRPAPAPDTGCSRPPSPSPTTHTASSPATSRSPRRRALVCRTRGTLRRRSSSAAERQSASRRLELAGAGADGGAGGRLVLPVVRRGDEGLLGDRRWTEQRPRDRAADQLLQLDASAHAGADRHVRPGVLPCRPSAR